MRPLLAASYGRPTPRARALRSGDLIMAVNGEFGLSASEVATRLEAQPGPLVLTVQRSTLRTGGSKNSRAARDLASFPVRYVTQCMMLYPQDASLQRAGCERLARAVVAASARTDLALLIAEVRGAFLLPVVVNAMEVHVHEGGVLIAAARLLCCLANTEGNLRANLVAAVRRGRRPPTRPKLCPPCCCAV